MSAGRGSVAARIWALAAKETLQIVRDRTTLGMLLGVPLIQVLLFGFAIQLTPRSLGLTIVTGSAAVASQLSQSLQGQTVDVAITVVSSEAIARRELRRGQVALAVLADEIPIRVLVDGSDPVLATFTEALVDRLSRTMGDSATGIATPPSALRVETLFNPELRTQPYLVSGLLGLILTMTMVMMSALSLARERERGTLENLVTLGARPLELTIGKLSPYLLLGMLQAVIVLSVALFAFGIHIAGSILLLGAAVMLFAVANLALGFLFSSLAAAQMPAMQMTFFFFLPSSLLSGFMFPFSAMPAWAQRLGEMLPLTHFLRIARGIVLRAVDTEFVLQEIVPIAVFALIASVAAAWRCRRVLSGA